MVLEMKADMLKRKGRPVIPLPFPVYYWQAFTLAFLGLADAVYLSISHYRVYTDIGYKSFCAISKAINCDTVSQSPYSILLGVPVPVWGVMGYAWILALIGYAGSRDAGKQRLWAAVLMTSFLYSLYSVSLGVISAVIIHSYCLMCIVSYAINLMLLFYAWLIRRRFAENGVFSDLRLDISYIWRQKRISGVCLLSGFITVSALMMTLFPAYWILSPPPLSENIRTGVTADGHPWIGAASPVLEITEFMDYQCFQCKKMDYFLRQLVLEHPDKLRLIHRQFPMDNKINPVVTEPFHVGSAAMSLLAIFAQSKGKFWEMNDVLFNTDISKGVINIPDLIRKAGIEDSGAVPNIYAPQYMTALWTDIREGVTLGVTGTPGFLINGRLYEGQIPPKLLEKVLK